MHGSLRFPPSVRSWAAGACARLRPITSRQTFPPTQLVVPEPVTFRASDGVEVHGQLFRRPGTGRRDRARQSSTCTAADRGRCCSAGTIAGNTRTTTASISTREPRLHRAVGRLSPERRLRPGLSSFRSAPARAAHPSTSTSWPRALSCRSGPTSIRGASASGAPRTAATSRRSRSAATPTSSPRASTSTASTIGLPAINPTQLAHAIVGDGLTEADLRQALKVEFESSPISAVATWKSPVLLIHGDDDRTVDFRQTIDLGGGSRRKASRSRSWSCPTMCTIPCCGGTGRRR